MFSHIFLNFSGKSGKISGKFLCFTIEQFCQTLHFALCIFDLDMSVSVQSYTYVGMTHYILQRFWIHSAFSHIRAESVSANVLKCRAQHTSYCMYSAVAFFIDLLEFYQPSLCVRQLDGVNASFPERVFFKKIQNCLISTFCTMPYTDLQRNIFAY